MLERPFRKHRALREQTPDSSPKHACSLMHCNSIEPGDAPHEIECTGNVFGSEEYPCGGNRQERHRTRNKRPQYAGLPPLPKDRAPRMIDHQIATVQSAPYQKGGVRTVPYSTQ